MDRDVIVQTVGGALLIVFGTALLWAVWMAHRPYRRRKRR